MSARSRPLTIAGAALLTGLAALLLPPAVSQAAPGEAAAAREMEVPAALRARGGRRFLFDQWAGPPIPVWYVRGTAGAADAPVLFVMHGVRRDADRYLAEWIDLARREGLVVVVPEFSREAFPGAQSYNFGRMIAEDGQPRPRAEWSYAAIEPIFDALRAREGLSAPDYAIYGHSAGAQFVHRLVLTGSGPRLRLAIAANAGSYAEPRTDVPWPFGMGGLPADAWRPAEALAAPLLLLLGTADNDPRHPSLPDQPGARAQGPHRLARGLFFYASGRKAAADAGLAFGWSCLLVPGVGHDNAGMAPAAVDLIFGRVRAGPGAPCRTP